MPLAVLLIGTRPSMSNILDIPEPSPAPVHHNEGRESRKWTIALCSIALLNAIITVVFLPWDKGHAPGIVSNVASFIGSCAGSFVVDLFLGMIVWLVAWPFARKKMEWRAVAMYSTFAGGLLTLLSLYRAIVFLLPGV
jgi:hypothetical protein